MSQGETNLILGATGMVGGHALEHALAHPQVKEVRTLGRRKLAQEHPKLRQWVAADLEKLDDEACFKVSQPACSASVRTRERWTVTPFGASTWTSR